MNNYTRSLLIPLLACLPWFANADELKGWSLHAADYPVVAGMQHFATQLAAKTNGKYTGQVFPNASLGDQNKAVEMLAKGEIDFAVINNTPMAKAVPQMGALSLPFLFRNSAHMLSVMDGDIGKDLERLLAAKGFVVVGWYDGGARSFYTRNKTTRFVADFEGLKLRVADNKLFKDMISSLGATPVTIAFKDVKDALARGEIDGAENNLPSFESEEHFRHARVYTISNHIVLPEALVVSPALWKKLSDAEKEAFREAGRESAQVMRELWNKRLAENRARLEKAGVRFTEVHDSGAFISRMGKIYKPFMDDPETGALVMRMMTLRAQ